MSDYRAGGFPRLQIQRKHGSEPFRWGSRVLGVKLIDVWRWSTSDLLSNATRGTLAECIVASALDLAQGVRAEWDAVDLITPSGICVEVKSAAYLQSWYHREGSKIVFSIRPTRRWDAETNQFARELRRQADVYVFCVLNHKQKASVDPLNLEQWELFGLAAATLKAKLPNQRSLGLAQLLVLSPLAASYETLPAAVQAAYEQGQHTTF